MIIRNKEGDSLECTIRPARSAEVSKLILLMTKQHGRNYPDPQMYNEDDVRKRLENGSFFAAVAECAGGTPGGMVWADGGEAEEPFAGGLLFKLLTIEPRLRRGFGLGRLLLQFLLDGLPVHTYTAVYSYCMTLDEASQLICEKLNFHTTGILFNRYMFDERAEYLAGLDLPVKYNQTVVCLPQSKKDAGLLYAPPSYIPYITGVYEALGVTYTLRPCEEQAPPRLPSALRVKYREQDRYCEFIIDRGGEDAVARIDDALVQYGTHARQTFNAFVNLNDSGNRFVCRSLEERGFFFTGLQALSGAHEYMLFHYSPALPIPFEQVAVLPAFKDRFLWIRRCRQENACLK